MGYQTRKFSVSVLLSDHGGDRQERDERLWKEMLYKLKEVAMHPDYEGIFLDMDSWDVE